MSRITIYEGDLEQLHGNDFAGEPIGREQDSARHLPESAIRGDVSLGTPYSRVASEALAACVEPVYGIPSGQAIDAQPVLQGVNIVFV